MSSSVTNVATTPDTPDENRRLHSITVTCTIRSDRVVDQCVVMAVDPGRTTITSIELCLLNFKYVHVCVCMYI